jgi:hypothetical protein
MFKFSRDIFVWVALALIGFAVLIFHTRNGPGITGDSVSYVMGAENMLLGRGYARTAGAGEAVPITGFPPGYSTALFGFSWLNKDMFQVSRWLNAGLFGINIFLVCYILYEYTGSQRAAFFGGALTLLSEDLIHAHSWVMSEGLFLTLSLLGLLFFLQYFDRDRVYLLAISGGLFALATLTRYVGVALMAAGGLVIVFSTSRTIKQRAKDLFAFGVIAVVPVALWLYRNASLEGTATNRELGFHPPSSELMRAFLGTVNAWVFPLRLGLPDWVRAPITVFVLVVVPMIILYRLKVRPGMRISGITESTLSRLPFFLILYIPIYAFVLMANTTFLDAGTSLAGAARYLTPIFPAAVMLVLGLVYTYGESGEAQTSTRRIAMGFAVLVLGMYMLRAYQFVSDPGEVFRYTDSKRNMPDVVAALEGIDEDRILISNDIQLVYVLTDRPAYLFPLFFDVYREKERDDFEEQVAFAQEKLDDGAVLIMFKPMKQEQLDTLELLKVKVLKDYEGATLFESN